METKSLDDLHANPKNPRQMSDHDGNALLKSMDKFGDLSCIVFNIRTQQLVGGHQRIRTLKKLMGDAKVHITQRFDNPNKVGTVAIGYVIHDGKEFAYREVDWDPDWELAANIAANRIQGEFDIDMLAEATYHLHENNADALAMTGQTEDEVKRLLKQSGAMDEEPEDAPKDDDKLVFRLTREQREIVEEALENIKATREIAADETGSKNGYALYYLSRDHLDRIHGLTEAPSE